MKSVGVLQKTGESCEPIAYLADFSIHLGLRLRGGVAEAKRGRESDDQEEPNEKRRSLSPNASNLSRENMEVDPQPEAEVPSAPTAVVRPLSSAAARSTAQTTAKISRRPSDTSTQKKTPKAFSVVFIGPAIDSDHSKKIPPILGVVVVVDHYKKLPQALCLL